jgi:hypothetical protein
MQPSNDLLKRIGLGALAGGALGILCILVGVMRALFFVATGGDIAPLSPDDVRLLAFYVVGFIVAGTLVSAIWPLLGSGLAQYLGFSLAGAVVGIAVIAGEKGGLAAHEPAQWIIGILVGVFLGCAFAYGFRRVAA